MTEFEIKDVNSNASLRFEGEIPRGLTGYDGFHFVISLSAMPLSANVSAYDIQPNRWSNFFADLATNWRGWTGVKDRQSLEGHLRLEATADLSGHIRLRIRLRGMEVGSNWLAEISIALEAGQLEDLANRARAYFG
jgi:hypothetical protein